MRQVVHYLVHEILPNPSQGYDDQPPYFWEILGLFNQTKAAWETHKEKSAKTVTFS